MERNLCGSYYIRAVIALRDSELRDEYRRILELQEIHRGSLMDSQAYQWKMDQVKTEIAIRFNAQGAHCNGSS